MDKNSQGPFYAEEIHLYTQQTLKRGLPKRGKHHKTTCDVPAVNTSKLSAAQEDVIDSSRGVEGAPTHEEIVSNPLRAVDNTSIDKPQLINRNIIIPNGNSGNKFSNGKRASPALDVANPKEQKRAELIPTRRSSRIKSYENNDSDYAKLKASTHIATAISSDNPFVMLALDKIQEAIVDDKNPPKHVLDNEDYEPPTRRLMLKCRNHAKWEEAEQDELRSFHLCKVLSKTPPIPEGVKPLPLKWIYKLKKDLRNIILRHKARLVAQGFFQIFGIDYTDTYSPVAKFVSIRIFLAISVQLGLIVHSMDVDTAFLNADIDEDIWVKIPDGTKLATNDDGIYKLNKSLYGLKQASRNWNNDINEYLISNDFTRLEADPCIYVKIVEVNNNGIITKQYQMVALYVDDLLISGSTKNLVTKLESFFEAKYKMKKLNVIKQLLGMGIYHDKDRNIIYISQQQYITSLVKLFQKYGISEFRTPMDERQHYSKSQMPKAGSAEALQMATLPYRELIGSLLWVSNGTRPDVTYPVNTLTKFTSNPALIHWRAALRILGFLNTTKNYCIRYAQQLYMDTISSKGL